MTFETIAGEDFVPIAEKLVDMEQPLPNPNLPHMAFVVRDDRGDLKGLAVLSCVALIEPFFVNGEPDGGMTSARLFAYVEQFIKDSGVHRLLMHTGHPLMAKMIERAEGKKIEDSFFEFRKEWNK